MGVEHYMLAPALNLIVAQRLVRKICPNCGTKRDANYAEAAEIKDTLKKISDLDPKLAVIFDGKIAEKVGCDQCNGTGYK